MALVSGSSFWLTATLGLCTVFVFARLFRTRHDPNEPPLVSPGIPYIGHVLGIMRKKYSYYAQLSRQHPHPIFSMAMPGSKIYVVTAVELIQAVQKQPKILAFPPIEAKFASRVCGSSPEAHKILMNNVNGEEGDWGLSMESYAAMRAALTPGPALDNMNRVMVENIMESLESLRPHKGTTSTINFAEWLRDSITLATTNSVYGPHNPFKDKAIADAYWQFESELVAILVGFIPSLLARKGIQGRTEVTRAFERYFQNSHQNEGSVLIKNRYETSLRNGISVEDIARYEVGGATAILVNTASAAFWMLFLVYSRRKLLADLRQEIDSVRTMVLDVERRPQYCLDITSLKTRCPLLTSTFQEVLRYRSMGTSIRQVMADTLLNDRWLLKKDAMVQMPSYVIHNDPSLWGADVDDFRPRRFMKAGDDDNYEPQQAAGGKAQPQAAAFRAFGGGATLCPGRHFATNEVLAVVSMFVLRYDVAPESGEWEMPTVGKTNVAAVIMEPDTDFRVAISEREGYEGAGFSFNLKGSEDIFAVVAEDRGG